MAIGSDGRYYAEAEKPKGVNRADYDTAKAKFAGNFKRPEPVPEPNKSVDPANHPAAGAEKKPEAVKEQQKK